MSASPTTEPGRLLLGRYRLVNTIGLGASARVHLAEDTSLHRQVAVKVLHDSLAHDETFLRRFRAEARAAAALSHPNIVAIHDWGEDDVAPFLVTELLSGGSLRAVLDSGVRLSASQALLVGLEAARGLDHAHRQGLVHRDIKPANLLFGRDGRLRIADFGLARALAESTLTEPGGVMLGTPRYASPEQARGEALDGRADVYSLALTLVEAVTGKPSFSGDTPIATLMARTQGDLEVPEALGRLKPILERAGRLRAADRPDAGELEIAFMAAAEDMVRPERLALPGLPTGLGPATTPPAGSGAPTPAAQKIETLAADPPATGSRRRPANLFDQDALEEDITLLAAASHDAQRHRGRLLSSILLVLLLVAGAAAGWWFLRTPTHEVPELVGRDADEVDEIAERFDWTVAEPELVRRDGTVEGEIVEQSPAAGENLEEGGTLRLTVSLGNELTDPPAVAGLDEAAARAAVEGAGLVVGESTQAYSEDVAIGLVVSLSPQAEASAEGRIPKGTIVDLVISAGPEPRTVPGGLAGGTPDAARSAVEALGLVYVGGEEYSETVPAGTVVRTDPAEGTTIERGSNVAVMVSLGPAPVPIPDVRGMSASAAASTLESQGFVVVGVEGSPSGEVLQTDPPAGEAHLRGTQVRIFTRR